MYSFVMVLVLLLLSYEVSSVSVGSRSILRAIRDKADDQLGDAVVDLNGTNFDAFLQKSRATDAVIEFYAHWYISLPLRNAYYHSYFYSKLCLLLMSTYISISYYSHVPYFALL